MRIAADPVEVRSQGGRLRAAGTGLLTSASLGASAGGLGGAGGGTPRTAAALGLVGRAWSRGLTETGQSLVALGDYADAVAAAFEQAGG